MTSIIDLNGLVNQAIPFSFLRGEIVMERKAIVSLVVLFVVFLTSPVTPAHALYDQSGECLNKGCIEDQMARVGKILQELRQYSGVHSLGYVIYVPTGESRFKVQSGILNKRSDGASILWKFRAEKAGALEPTFLLFGPDMKPVER